jgi:biopolymer transport protein ExbD
MSISLRKRPEHTAPEVDLGIIITPMLDMAFQLLAFFIMTYRPSLFERHIDGNLLPSLEQTAKGAEVAKPDVKPPTEIDPKQFITVKVQTPEPDQQEIRRDSKGRTLVIKHGEPSKIWVKRIQSPTEEIVCEVEDLLNVKEGMDKLARELRQQKDADPVGGKLAVNLVADGDLRIEYVILINDACRRAGYTSVNFIAPADEKK